MMKSQVDPKLARVRGFWLNFIIGTTMAAVTKRVRGEREFWEARVTIKGHPQLSKTFDKNKKRDAVKWAQEQEVKIRGGDKVSRKSERSTVADALSEYLAAHTTTDAEGEGETVSTLTNTNRYGVESVKYHLGDFTIDTLSHKVISAFLKKLQVTPIPQPANKTKTHPLYDGDRVRCYTPGSARKLLYVLKIAIERHSHEYHYPLGDRIRYRRRHLGYWQS